VQHLRDPVFLESLYPTAWVREPWCRGLGSPPETASRLS